MADSRTTEATNPFHPIANKHDMEQVGSWCLAEVRGSRPELDSHEVADDFLRANHGASRQGISGATCINFVGDDAVVFFVDFFQ